MKKRIVSLLAVIMMALTLMSVTASPASAAGRESCTTYYNGGSNPIKTCFNLTWINDGGFLRLTSVSYSTPVGCSRLNAQRYIRWDLDFPGYQRAFGQQSGCSGAVGLYQKAPLQGATTVYAYMKANVNNWTDVGLYWVINIYPNGTSTVVEHSATPPGNPGCCD